MTKNAHTWFWVRTSPPRKPVWNRCVEFEIKTPEGVTETHFINGKTGIVTKVGVEDGGKLLFFASCAHYQKQESFMPASAGPETTGHLQLNGSRLPNYFHFY